MDLHMQPCFQGPSVSLLNVNVFQRPCDAFLVSEMIMSWKQPQLLFWFRCLGVAQANPYFLQLVASAMADKPVKRRRSTGSSQPGSKKGRTMDDYATPSWLPEVKKAVDLLSNWMLVPEPFECHFRIE